MGLPVRIGMVGSERGSAFPGLYARHPDALLAAWCPQGGDPYPSFEALISNPAIDAIHIDNIHRNHASLAIAALRAGKHVACAPPMATSLDDCRAIVEAARRHSRVYMMMVPAVYSPEFLCVKRLLDRGDLGPLRFLRGEHRHVASGTSTGAENPSLLHAIAAVGPLLSLIGKRARWVSSANGDGADRTLRTALVRLRDCGLSIEIAAASVGSPADFPWGFDVRGDRLAVAWRQAGKDRASLFRSDGQEPVPVPDFSHLLPEDLRRGARRTATATDPVAPATDPGGDRDGSLPHLAHEFIRSIVENRRSMIDEATAANWTGVGICAHASAARGGVRVDIPDFDGE